MERLIVCETERGRYAVRPMSWAGIWNEKGQIKETLNHLALFIEKEDAEKFVEWKEAEEQGKLLRLPCAVGDIIYEVSYENREFVIKEHTVKEFVYRKYCFPRIEIYCEGENGFLVCNSIGKLDEYLFLARPEAERALAEMEGKK